MMMNDKDSSPTSRNQVSIPTWTPPHIPQLASLDLLILDSDRSNIFSSHLFQIRSEINWIDNRRLVAVVQVKVAIMNCSWADCGAWTRARNTP